jgi:hypothetical protein
MLSILYLIHHRDTETTEKDQDLVGCAQDLRSEIKFLRVSVSSSAAGEIKNAFEFFQPKAANKLFLSVYVCVCLWLKTGS